MNRVSGGDTPAVISDTPVEVAAEWIATADRILVAAGAGLTAAAGFDYGDTTDFAESFPAMAKLGFSARYQLIGQPLPEAILWGYWAEHVHQVRFAPVRTDTYDRLRSLVGDTPHAVWTSNVDGLFGRSSFDEQLTYTMQGDYGRYQCLTPCTRDTWPIYDIVQRARAATDPTTGEVTDPEAIPRCPNCSGPVFPNVHAGPWYIGERYRPTGERVVEWIDAARSASERITVLEIGAGFNTPSVVRWPMEAVIASNPGSRLIRVNLDHPEVPADLAGRSATYSADINDLLPHLRAASQLPLTS